MLVTLKLGNPQEKELSYCRQSCVSIWFHFRGKYEDESGQISYTGSEGESG